MISPQRPEVVISGFGAVCALGEGCTVLEEALLAGRDGLRTARRFPVGEFQTRVAGLFPPWDEREAATCSALELATLAALEAWKRAGLQREAVAPARIAVILGTCFGEHFQGFSELTEGLARTLGATGPRLTVSTACSSSTTAVGLGRDLLEEGRADVVIAGGVDVLTREVFAGFHALGALSVDKCAPFGEPAGTSLSEGAGFVVLERAAQAHARGAEIHGAVEGYGLSADAHHETAPDPSGRGVLRAFQAALADAGLPPDAIDYVSAHGTGTASNDAAEWLAISAALGPAATKTPVSSTKSFFGHAQGAAGVLELIAALLCARRGLIPPTLRSLPARPGAPSDAVSAAAPRTHPVTTLAKLSAAFGGANAALLVSPRPLGRTRSSPARREVRVAGWSAVGPHGLDVPTLQVRLRSGERMTGRVPAFDLREQARCAPDREMDPSGQYATAAVALALADAKVEVRGGLRERAGLFTGTTRMPAASAHACRSSIDRRGILGVAPGPFTRMVLNAPAGTAAKLLSLKGPLLSLAGGTGSGLLAIVRAAEHLAGHRSASLLVAGGHDELPVTHAEGFTEGAGMVVLTAEPDAAGGDQLPRGGHSGLHSVAQVGGNSGRQVDSGLHSAARVGGKSGPNQVALTGWGLAGPGELATAVDEALGGEDELDGVYLCLSREPEGILKTRINSRVLRLGLIDVDGAFGGATATASAWAFVLAAEQLRRGEAKRLLVVSSGDSVSCAAVLSAVAGA